MVGRQLKKEIFCGIYDIMEKNGNINIYWKDEDNVNGEMMDHKILYARTLGALEIHYGGEPWGLPASAGGKVMQLLLLLIWGGEGGISRVKLQDFLYDRRTTDAANALRITASRLRKMLSQSSLPQGEYVVADKTKYYLKSGGGGVKIQMDACLMEEYYNQAIGTADDLERQRLLENACQLYKGEFLPVMSGEEWVESLRSHYQEIYFNCVRETFLLMKRHRDYDKMLKLCDEAMEAYPLAEWGEQKIEVLLAQKSYGDALRTYEYMTRKFIYETGGIPSESILHQLKQIGSQIEHMAGDIDDIRKSLLEDEWSAGAYYCTYPGFVDCFRMGCRAVERGKRKAFLIVCTIRDGKDRPVEDSSKLREYGDVLCEIVHVSLRRGDIYTKYSPDQVLIIANDLKEDKCRIVENRIISGMRQHYGQKVSLHIQSINLDEWIAQTGAPEGGQKGKRSVKRKKQ